jgi:hypothetical protein
MTRFGAAPPDLPPALSKPAGVPPDFAQGPPHQAPPQHLQICRELSEEQERCDGERESRTGFQMISNDRNIRDHFFYYDILYKLPFLVYSILQFKIPYDGTTMYRGDIN